MSVVDYQLLIVSGFGLANIALLTGIFFRLGRGAARFEEIYRRIEALEAMILETIKGVISK